MASVAIWGEAVVAVNRLVAKRFAELETLAQAIREEPSSYSSSGVVDEEQTRRWASSAMHLVASVFGENSPHYRNLAASYQEFHGYAAEVRAMRGVFLAAKSDYDGGYLFSLEAAIAGEVFGDFVTLAKAALSEGRKDVAGVLACAALEDTLKRYARSRGLNIEGKEMSTVIGALKGAGLLSGPQKSLVDAMPQIRNAALHAEWHKLTQQDVGSVIGYIENFLLTNFSS